MNEIELFIKYLLSRSILDFEQWKNLYKGD